MYNRHILSHKSSLNPHQRAHEPQEDQTAFMMFLRLDSLDS
ncbi:hypothetical protein [Helicobacter sp.]